MVPYSGTDSSPTSRERKLAEEEIHHLAFFDPLTRAAFNRRLLLDRLQQVCATTDREGNARRVAVPGLSTTSRC